MNCPQNSQLHSNSAWLTALFSEVRKVWSSETLLSWMKHLTLCVHIHALLDSSLPSSALHLSLMLSGLHNSNCRDVFGTKWLKRDVLVLTLPSLQRKVLSLWPVPCVLQAGIMPLPATHAAHQFSNFSVSHFHNFPRPLEGTQSVCSILRMSSHFSLREVQS